MADYIRPVVFTLGGQKFGVDINLVQSIERQVDVVPVPNAMKYISGIVNLRGEVIPKIQNDNWFDYDVIVATPDMMGVVGRLGKVLGPKGLMPNPKSGTVTMDVTKAINEIKSGKVEYRLDKTNIIHLGFGKVSFGAEKLAENYDAIMGAIIKAKPAAAKGQYIRSVSVSTTMGPGLYINQK